MQAIKLTIKAALIALALYITVEAYLTIIKTMVDAQERNAEFTQRVNDHGD